MKIRFYCSSGDRYYVEEFIVDLAHTLPKAVKKIRRDLGLLEKYGVSFMTKSGNMKKLQGYDMYEIIIGCYRIFCVVRQAACWLLTCLSKRHQIHRLERLRLDYKGWLI